MDKFDIIIVFTFKLSKLLFISSIALAASAASSIIAASAALTASALAFTLSSSALAAAAAMTFSSPCVIATVYLNKVNFVPVWYNVFCPIHLENNAQRRSIVHKITRPDC